MSTVLWYKNILFCTDFSDDAHFAFQHALDLSKKHKAKLHLLHVITAPSSYRGPQLVQDLKIYDADELTSEEKIKTVALAAMTNKYGEALKVLKSFTFAVRFGSPDVEIINYSKNKNMDMIILGALGKMEKDRKQNIRTAANVSKFGNCQVIAIRSPVRS